MWPLGHAAVGYLVYSLGADRDWFAAPSATVVLALLLGTQVPDLVDKPLAWYLPVLPAGRSLGHSLLLLVPIAVAAVGIAIAIDRSAIGVALAVGLLAHPLVDVVPVLWDGGATWRFLLWPVLEIQGYPEGAPSILGMVRADADDPWFHLEFVLAGLALVRWRRDGTPGLSRTATPADA